MRASQKVLAKCIYFFFVIDQHITSSIEKKFEPLPTAGKVMLVFLWVCKDQSMNIIKEGVWR
jgi:hypothetical protein